MDGQRANITMIEKDKGILHSVKEGMKKAVDNNKKLVLTPIKISENVSQFKHHKRFFVCFLIVYSSMFVL